MKVAEPCAVCFIEFSLAGEHIPPESDVWHISWKALICKIK